MMHKEHPQQVDCRETMERQYRGADDFHGDKGTTLFYITGVTLTLCPVFFVALTAINKKKRGKK
jgi:hypothetical protein